MASDDRVRPVKSSLFKVSFYATPHSYLLLNPDLKIIDANDCYLAATMTRRADIQQAGMFDVFPDNPEQAGADGVANLRGSLIRVLDTGLPDRMACQRYDIRDPDGVYQERWWQPLNIPVFDDSGRLGAIVHYVEDVTAGRKGSATMPADGAGISLQAAVEQSLREAETHIAQQKDIIKQLRRDGRPTEAVATLLKSIEQGHQRYAAKLRAVSVSRVGGAAFYAEWDRTVAQARSQLNQLDELLRDLRESVASNRRAMNESRSFLRDYSAREE
ncbi:MAG: PAS domain-containing protein [Alphaproteobacteria bacterium]|nr:PAS domain-containing protein [Alphaproteobacteria bacterium]